MLAKPLITSTFKFFSKRPPQFDPKLIEQLVDNMDENVINQILAGKSEEQIKQMIENFGQTKTEIQPEVLTDPTFQLIYN